MAAISCSKQKNVVNSNQIIVFINKNALLNQNSSEVVNNVYFKNFVLIANSSIFKPNMQHRKSDSINYKNNHKIMKYIFDNNLNFENVLQIYRSENIKYLIFITNMNQQIEIFRLLFQNSKIPFMILNVNKVNNFHFVSNNQVSGI